MDLASLMFRPARIIREIRWRLSTLDQLDDPKSVGMLRKR